MDLDKMNRIVSLVREARPQWNVSLEYPGWIDVRNTGLSDSVAFGDANETFGGDVMQDDGENWGYVNTWLSNDAPAAVLAAGLVRELEAHRKVYEDDFAKAGLSWAGERRQIAQREGGLET